MQQRKTQRAISTKEKVELDRLKEDTQQLKEDIKALAIQRQ